MDGHHFIGWIVIGIMAGFLAARLVEGRGRGCVMNMVVGLVGAVIGGLLIDRLAPDTDNGFLSSLLVSFLGACVLLGTLRLLGIGGPRHRAGQPRLSQRRR